MICVVCVCLWHIFYLIYKLMAQSSQQQHQQSAAAPKRWKFQTKNWIFQWRRDVIGSRMRRNDIENIYLRIFVGNLLNFHREIRYTLTQFTGILDAPSTDHHHNVDVSNLYKFSFSTSVDYIMFLFSENNVFKFLSNHIQSIIMFWTKLFDFAELFWLKSISSIHYCMKQKIFSFELMFNRLCGAQNLLFCESTSKYLFVDFRSMCGEYVWIRQKLK